MQLRKYDLLHDMELLDFKEQSFFEDIKSDRQIKAWKTKIAYLNMRLQHATLRKN